MGRGGGYTPTEEGLASQPGALGGQAQEFLKPRAGGCAPRPCPACSLSELMFCQRGALGPSSPRLFRGAGSQE